MPSRFPPVAYARQRVRNIERVIRNVEQRIADNPLSIHAHGEHRERLYAALEEAEADVREWESDSLDV